MGSGASRVVPLRPRGPASATSACTRFFDHWVPRGDSAVPIHTWTAAYTLSYILLCEAWAQLCPPRRDARAAGMAAFMDATMAHVALLDDATHAAAAAADSHERAALLMEVVMFAANRCASMETSVEMRPAARRLVARARAALGRAPPGGEARALAVLLSAMSRAFADIEKDLYDEYMEHVSGIDSYSAARAARVAETWASANRLASRCWAGALRRAAMLIDSALLDDAHGRGAAPAKQSPDGDSWALPETDVNKNAK